MTSSILTRTRTLSSCTLLLLLAQGCGGGGGGDGGSNAAAPPAPVNRAPVVVATSVTTNEDSPASARLTASDPDNNPLLFAIATNAQHGAATIAGDGTFTYTPAANWFGADTFTVTVSDNAGAQTTGTVSVTVTAVNDAPTLTSATQLVVAEDGALATLLTATDIEGDVVTFQYVAGIANGSLALQGSGALTYSPVPDYYGIESFSVRLVDANGAASADFGIGITVQPVEDTPTAADDQLRVAATPGAAVTIPVLANDVEPDGQPLHPEILTQPTGGTLTVNANREIVFTPANGYLGPLEFTYRVNDGNGNTSDTATASAVVGPFESLLFLSDYTTPGTLDIHLYDGLSIRPLTDFAAAGGGPLRFTYSLDGTTLLYTVYGATNDRVYVKPIQGTAPARLVYTSATKGSSPSGTSATINRDATYLLVYDPHSSVGKNYFIVDLATGTTTRLGVDSPQVLDLRIVVFSPVNPNILAMSGQMAGTVPNNFNGDWNTAFMADAANPRTLTRIGRDYTPAEGGGSGEGAYFSHDGRYIYYGERTRIAITTNQLFYDRQTQTEAVLHRRAPQTERGGTGDMNFSRDRRRLCFGFHEPGVTAIDGPARFWVDGADETAVAVSQVHPDTTQCAFAADSRTVVYRHYTAGRVSQRAYAWSIDGAGLDAIEWPGVVGFKQSGWLLAYDAMNIAISYFPNNGVPSFAGQVGRFYSIALDGSSPPFLFRDNFVQPTAVGTSVDAKGTFITYGRQNGAIASLELMSTRLLNHSIPLSRNTETLGVVQAQWLRTWD